MPLPLFGYQTHAANIMASRDRYGLHDEMGIGKTATTVGAINRINVERPRGLIIAPAMLRENWIKEFAKFSTQQYNICKGRTIHDYIAWSRGRFDILVTSYEQASKWTPEFIKRGEVVDFIAFDEAHYLKNAESGRTKFMLGQDGNGIDCMLEWAIQSWHVTGTPMANDPLDIYTFLRFAKAFDMTPTAFMKTFFDTRRTTYGTRNSVKPEMVGALQALIYNNSIRRTHQEVGMQLPPIWMKEVLVDGDTREVADMLKQYPGLEQAIFDAIEEGGLSFLEAQHIATLRRLIGKAKAVPYAQMLKWELDAGATKRVVFCIHTEPLEYLAHELRKYGYNVVVAHGATNEKERQAAVRQFMEDAECDVFIGNMKVAGVGLTLVSGNTIDLFESDWTPAGNAQAIKRVHRYGQTRDVHARFITLANSFDEQVNRIVAGKTAAIAQIEGSSMNAAPSLLTA